MLASCSLLETSYVSCHVGEVVGVQLNSHLVSCRLSFA
jgi:hypothetical protein